MLDFASSLYLGLRHDSCSLDPWDALTLGRPAALQEPAAAVAVARELATLVGCDAGTLLPSTFHLFWDLIGVLSRQPIEIYMDPSTYPIARWGAEHWAGKGVPLHMFRRHDVGDLERSIGSSRRRRPVVLCDGLSPGSSSQPPLAAYADLARQHGGWLVVDDTQALGVLGRDPSPTAPYGRGGGGTLRRHGYAGEQVIVGASLAKAFGAPVALLAGSTAILCRFLRHSASREHMSPPSMAVIQAARHALAANRLEGDCLRLRLWRNVRRLRAALNAAGLAAQGGDFPVQSLQVPPDTDMAQLHADLQQRGVLTVLHRDRGGGASISMILRADQSASDVDRAAAQVAKSLNVSLVAARNGGMATAVAPHQPAALYGAAKVSAEMTFGDVIPNPRTRRRTCMQ